MIWLDREAEIFFAMGLDSPNHTKSSPSGAMVSYLAPLAPQPSPRKSGAREKSGC
jgi:hypothetical protein